LNLKTKLNLGAIVVGLSGVAFILVAMNHVQHLDPVLTFSATIHRDSAVATVIMSPVACFLLTPALKTAQHGKLAIYSICAGVAAVVAIAAGFLIPTGSSTLLGAFERFLLVNGQVWAEVICVKIIWDTFRSWRPITPS
jgi:hypothetical protein